jgi:hypothetical protein
LSTTTTPESLHTETTPPPERQTVSIVITTRNEDPRFLKEAIESAQRQTIAPEEILVVDDGSDAVDSADVLRHFRAVRVVRQQNRGLSSARNAGWRAASGFYVVFLDSDDRLLPGALASNLRLFAEHSDCGFVYGAYRFVDREGHVLRPGAFYEIGPDPYAALLAGNCIGMHATVMYRRDRLEATGGFDPAWRACEDYELYLRLGRHFAVACGPEVIAEYRQHDRNMSNDIPMMLRTALRVLHAQSSRLGENPTWCRACADGARGWKEHYATVQLSRAEEIFRKRAFYAFPIGDLLRVFLLAPLVMPRVILRYLAERLRDRVGRGRIDFGGLRRTTPYSRCFGYDRGTPVDRRYIEGFLERHAADVRGRVLEVGDNTYTRRFGGERVTQSDVLHVNPAAPGVTFVADLSAGDCLPTNAFDCIVLTQTLHLIFDLAEAVATLHRILKAGGVLLATVPGVSSVDRGEWGGTWFWSLTALAMRRLLETRFSGHNVAVESYGNVLTAVAFLHGLAEDELEPHEYAPSDPQYPVIVAARAVK